MAIALLINIQMMRKVTNVDASNEGNDKRMGKNEDWSHHLSLDSERKLRKSVECNGIAIGKPERAAHSDGDGA